MADGTARVWRRGLRLLLRNPKEFARYVSRHYSSTQRRYRRRLRMSLRSWLLYHQRTIVFEKCSWMGRRALKNPIDSWVYQEILFEARPDVVVEIGSADGGSTLFFAHMLDLIGHGEVISVDIDRSTYLCEHPRVSEVTGDSGQVADDVARMCEGKRALVVHDGNHDREPVLRDLRLYAPLVAVGSYLIVEDSVMDLFWDGDGMGAPQEGPLPAIEQFVAENPGFEIDASRERYLLTYNPCGFLKRVR